MTLTALPTQPSTSTSTLFNPLSLNSPQNDIDDLVANLVDGGAPSPAVSSLGLSLGGVPGIGVSAMREQLKAAERKGLDALERRRIDKAAIGIIRGTKILEGATTFLIALTSDTIPAVPEIPEMCTPGISALQSLGLEIPLDLENLDEPEEFGITSLSQLEETFGSSKKMMSHRSSVTIETTCPGGSREGCVELCELVIQTNAPGGPRESFSLVMESDTNESYQVSLFDHYHQSF